MGLNVTQIKALLMISDYENSLQEGIDVPLYR